MTDQRSLFRDREGDAWYTRNRAHLDAYDPAGDYVLRAVVAAGLSPRRILDLGCSSGTRLSHWCERFRADGVGIDASAEAVRAARLRDPHRRFEHGTLDDHPEIDPAKEGFDLVLVAFVLHWVDRRLLLRSLAGIDARVRDGGALVIADFLPDFPQRREYHHRPGEGIYTYKNDYAEMVLATGLYRPLLRQSLEYPSYAPAVPGSQVRCQVAVLERIPPTMIPMA